MDCTPRVCFVQMMRLISVLENMDKIKLAIVCHFSNPKVRECMHFSSSRLFNIGRRLFGLEPKRTVLGDVSPWVTYLVEFLSKRDDIELNVVSSHSALNRKSYYFRQDNVDYHFVNIGYSTMLKYLLRFPSLWHKFNPLRRRVKHIVEQIRPDLVALIGAENGFIADAVLGLFNYPVIIQCQTIYNNPNRVKFDQVDPINAWVERELFKRAKYVAIPTKMHYDIFMNMEQNAVILDWKAKTPLPDVPVVNQKKYDFVCYAVNMCEKKGYHDAVKALGIVCKQYPQTTLNLVGGGSIQVKNELKQLAEQLNVVNNVIFTDFFEKQTDLFVHIQKSRFALLPCKLDHISGTMIQAMNYGLPLVCYKTSGTPQLNKEKECALIAEIGDVNELAEKMLLLIEKPEIGQMLVRNARERLKRKNNMPQIVERLVATYKAIVNKERNNSEIPEELLFNPKAV